MKSAPMNVEAARDHYTQSQQQSVRYQLQALIEIAIDLLDAIDGDGDFEDDHEENIVPVASISNRLPARRVRR